MKKLLTFIFAAALWSMPGALFTACNKQNQTSGDIEPHPLANCYVVAKITPGEEMLLFAKSGIESLDEVKALRSKFASEYGGENIVYGLDLPIEEISFGLDSCYTLIAAGLGPYCYEITETFQFPEMSMPTAQRLTPALLFGGARIDCNIAIVKGFGWAFTDKGAKAYADISVEYVKRLYGGERVGEPCIKNMGLEAYNVPLEF